MSPLGKRQREPGIARLQAVGGCQEHASEYVWLMRQEDDYRRDRHVVSALTVHLVSVSKYWRGVLTGEHLQAPLGGIHERVRRLRRRAGRDGRPRRPRSCDGQLPTQLAVARLVNPLKGVCARRLAALPGANPLVVPVVLRRVGRWHPMRDAQGVQRQPRAPDPAGATPPLNSGAYARRSTVNGLCPASGWTPVGSPSASPRPAGTPSTSWSGSAWCAAWTRWRPAPMSARGGLLVPGRRGRGWRPGSGGGGAVRLRRRGRHGRGRHCPGHRRLPGRPGPGRVGLGVDCLVVRAGVHLRPRVAVLGDPLGPGNMVGSVAVVAGAVQLPLLGGAREPVGSSLQPECTPTRGSTRR